MTQDINFQSPRFTRVDRDVRYLEAPGVALIAKTSLDPHAMVPFLEDFDPGFVDYARETVTAQEAGYGDGELLTKIAGQACYLSMGPNRTPHTEMAKYISNIMSQGHGSIAEHANYTFLVWGVDRAVTHELVRHRAGMGYSQVSQRFVGLDKLRFCMPFELQQRPELKQQALMDMQYDYERFGRWIDTYAKIFPQREGEETTEWRKRRQSAARRVLPNWVEAPIIFTGNIRALRHVFNMRCAKDADVAIRRAMIQVLKIMKKQEPHLFDDFEIIKLADGSEGATPKYKKI